jgi:hypothetical protein
MSSGRGKSGLILGLVGVTIWLAQAAGGDTKKGRAEKRPAQDPGKLIVHEWGTFLSVQGSDGVALGGMVESEEDLPAFVRERALGGRNPAGFNSKVETPVTYFYTDRPRVVRVRAAMPKGLLTHWYPAVKEFGPPQGRAAWSAPKESFLDWDRVELTPDPGPNDCRRRVLMSVRPVGDSTWRFVRDTDSAFVKVANAKKFGKPFAETEKFLFYRGLGAFDLPLEIKNSFWTRIDVRLPLRNRGHEPLPAVFVIRVESGTIQFAALGKLAGDASRDVVMDTCLATDKADLSPKLSLNEGAAVVKDAVAAALVQEGLYPKEARAMVNNWEKSYFHTEGLRVLYVLPRATVDATLPIRISPRPQELVRVMLGRVELLTQAKEREVERAVSDLGASCGRTRLTGQAVLNRLGRFREPALRRIAAITKDATIRARAEALIKAKAK